MRKETMKKTKKKVSKKKSKTGKGHPVVQGQWYVEPEYTLENVACPHCHEALYQYDFNFYFDEGESFNRVVKCPECGEKFKLKIEECDPHDF